MLASSDIDKTMDRLKSIARLHRVCWEVLPEEFVMADGHLLQVGFNLMLYGAHDHDTDSPLPGCPQCQVIYSHLREIAEWIVPKVDCPSRYEIEFYDDTVRFDPMRGNRPDVTVTIKILHRSRFDAPVDQCEVFCLHAMEGKLLQIGAQYQRWKEF
jgi:hypothetical protein